MRRNLCGSIAFAICLLGGCNSQWDLTQPFMISVETNNLDANAWEAAFTEVLQQLNPQIEVVQAAQQTIHIVWDDSCSCRSCDPYTTAHTEEPTAVWELQTVVNICPAWLVENQQQGSAAITDTAAHEAGRLWGFYGYLDCQGGAMMSQYFNCRTDHLHYQQADIQAFRDVGRLIGGIF